MRLALLLFLFFLFLGCGVARGEAPEPIAGQLQFESRGGIEFCPLDHTDVKADIAGIVGRVHVRQRFRNPSPNRLEAVYVFPLPEHSAVDGMTIMVGRRVVRGVVRERLQARKMYEQAKRAGHVAGLLDQERPNVFTQAVANIPPHGSVEVDITYVETLKWEDGQFEWRFPMGVGPRYIPGSRTPLEGHANPSRQVPDASRITPPYSADRPGHDIGLRVHIEAGLPIRDIRSVQHAVDVKPGARSGTAEVRLRNMNSIPNKDFVLRYRTATASISDAFLVHHDARGTFFTLVLQPPATVAPRQAVPKEMIFVIDRSGSMSGFPIEKAKQAMRLCIDQMNPEDTFNLMSFDGGTGWCFKSPVANTASNRKLALAYLDDLRGGGGTEMMPAIREALGGQRTPGRIRVVCFMSDGYVGNDFEILDAVKRHVATSRVFAFGIGGSVNRFLIEGMSRLGRGDAEFVTLGAKADEAARRFHQRIQSPVLTDIAIDWGDLRVADVEPRVIPDVFSAHPIVVSGRLLGPAQGTIHLHGRTAEGRLSRDIRVAPSPAEHDALASLWARARVQDLLDGDLRGLQSNDVRPDIRRRVTDLGLRYNLVTPFTSFVAVEQRIVRSHATSKTLDVPVAMPAGVRPEGVFGQSSGTLAASGGDPLLAVEAPENARQVVGLMPGGEIKRLRWNPARRRWEARFDIPVDAPEGEYRVTVIVVLEDGTRKRYTLAYAVDQTPPHGVGLALRDTSHIQLDIDTTADTARVSAILPWGARVELRPTSARGDHYTGMAEIPEDWRQSKWHTVTYVLTDRAHNRTTVTVDVSEP
jgi:Ca-activated chloride channel family protein